MILIYQLPKNLLAFYNVIYLPEMIAILTTLLSSILKELFINQDLLCTEAATQGAQ